ncbi:MAG: DUF2252 family protein [Elusimicrobia bacterium]|nr:DUF2252 family protein [Elusimicrobiota bacterium]
MKKAALAGTGVALCLALQAASAAPVPRAPGGGWVDALHGAAQWSATPQAREFASGDPFWGALRAALAKREAHDETNPFGLLLRQLEAAGSPPAAWIGEMEAAERARFVEVIAAARSEAAHELRKEAEELPLQVESWRQGPARELLEGLAHADRLRASVERAVATGLLGEDRPLAQALEGLAQAERGLRRAALARASAAIAGALTATDEEARLREFVEALDGSVLRGRPELFRLKMSKAAESDAAFNRAFPQLFYARLRRYPESGTSPSLSLAGDLHPENAELVRYQEHWAPQPNDLDDAGSAPVTLELARVLGGAGLLAERGERRRELIADAREGYSAALGLEFSAWTRAIREEKAVRRAKTKDRDWLRRAGAPVPDHKRADRLRALAGLDGPWRVYDRSDGGLSSIGLRRYLFIHPERRHVYELKELRDSALSYYTGPPRREDNRRRVEEAYRRLRRAPVKFRTLSFEGRDWALRRQEVSRTVLDLDHRRSSARVLGGLAAQLHRDQASAAELRAALAAAEPWVEDILEFMSRMRSALLSLLRSGTWNR